MLKWELTDGEVKQLRRFLEDEVTRLQHKISMTENVNVRTHAEGKSLELGRLLKSLNRASDASEHFETIAYCDTNFEFHSKRLTVSFRIGDEPTIHRETFENITPPPDEYLGILAVLRELKAREFKGRILLITDASRCAIALQMGLRYTVPKHTENQSPRSVNFGFSYDETIKLVKELDAAGCHVEFSYKHRGFINEALQIA